MEVGRSLDDIDQKVKKLNSSIRESTSMVRELDKALRLDPNDAEAMANKMKNLQNEVGLATQKVALLRQKQLEANKAFQNGDMTAKEFAKVELSVLKAENELKKYNNELEKISNSSTITKINNISKGFDNVSTSLQKAQSAASTFSKIVLTLVTSATALATAFTATTSSLVQSSKELEVNIEKLQLQRNVYKQITGDANNYDNALNSLKSALNNITLGQGTAYLNILNRLGVSTTDLEGNTKQLSDIYDEVVVALNEMENSTLRNNLAYELFGDSAISVLDVMQTSQETITELNEQQLELGITTEENAQTAIQLQETWEEIKTKFMSVGAELAESLLPLLQTLSEFILETIIPILTTVIGWFTSLDPRTQKFLAFLLMLIVILPKVISIITMIIGVVKAITVASYGAAGGIGAVSAASIPLIPIALAVVAVILTLALLFAFLTGRSNELTKQLDSQAGIMEGITQSYSDLESDFNVNTTQISENSNRDTIDVNVNIDASGDTQMSQQNAELIADILAQKINKELGGKI